MLDVGRLTDSQRVELFKELLPYLAEDDLYDALTAGLDSSQRWVLAQEWIYEGGTDGR